MVQIASQRMMDIFSFFFYSLTFKVRALKDMEQRACKVMLVVRAMLEINHPDWQSLMCPSNLHLKLCKFPLQQQQCLHLHSIR